MGRRSSLRRGPRGSPTSTSRLVPPYQTHQLHGKLGAKRTIYLNHVRATVLITQNTLHSCTCGGVGYGDAFDDTPSYYKLALMFAKELGGSEKVVAEAFSREAGHNMGLNHDGTSTSGYDYGATGWAPIVGTGSYQNTVRWRKGEYTDANNTEEDFAVTSASN